MPVLYILSHFSHVWLLATPWTVAHQVPLSMGIFQARILEWVAISSSKGSSQPQDQTHVLTSRALVGGFFTTSATWEAHTEDPPIQFNSIQFNFYANTNSSVSDSADWRAQRNSSYPHARKRALMRKWPCWPHGLALPASRTEKDLKNVLFNHPVYGLLLWLPEQTKSCP